MRLPKDWRPQVYSCGLSERLDRFQFIGDLHSAADHTRELLERVGIWESHGKRFINGGVKMGSNPCNIASHPSNHTVHVGFQQPEEATNKSAAHVAYNHAKGSKGKMDAYYSPELLEKVQEELYADDYKLWKLVNANGEKLSKGKELITKLSSKCAGDGNVAERTTGNTPAPTQSPSAESSEEEEEEPAELPPPIAGVVEALQPVTSKECCIPAVYKGKREPKDVLCFGTCFTERACTDKSYPFSSPEEKEMFPQANITVKYRQRQMKECRSPENLVPSVEWCQRPNLEAENATAAHLVENIPPAGCSTTTNCE